MGQKPVDKRSKYNTREYLWQLMLELKTFSARQLVMETRYHLSSIKSYLKGLTAAGYLKAEKTTGPASTWWYTIDPETAPLEPPRVHADGTAVTQGQGRKNLWRTMKMQKEFTISQLIAFASTPTVKIALGEAEHYTEYLCRAGYVSLIEGTSPRVYRFNSDRYTGPKAPMIQRVLNVYDANTGKVVWQSGQGGQQ
ncbi:MAG: hypothetical protein V1791_12710 [Pseudomonadota bacterium]